MLFEAELESLGYKQVTVLTSAVGLPDIPPDAAYAFVRAEGADVRYRDDGVAPTAAVGMPLTIDEPGIFMSQDLHKVRVIEQVATATLNVIYYKVKR